MLEDELKRIWQSSPNQERLKFERSRLMMDIQSGLDRFNRSIKTRDLSEIGLAVILIPLLGWEAYKNPFILSKFGAALGALWLIYVIVKLLRIRKLRPKNFASTYLDFLHKNRDYVKAQKKMRDTSLYWYIIPAVTSGILFFIGMGGDTQRLIKAILGAVGIGIVIYFYNLKIIKSVYVPKLKKINDLIEALTD